MSESIFSNSLLQFAARNWTGLFRTRIIATMLPNTHKGVDATCENTEAVFGIRNQLKPADHNSSPTTPLTPTLLVNNQGRTLGLGVHINSPSRSRDP